MSKEHIFSLKDDTIYSRRCIVLEANSHVLISKQSLRSNYQFFADYVSSANVAVVLKNNGFGYGYAEITPALYAQGCRRFYVADVEEALRMRSFMPHQDVIIAPLFPLISQNSLHTMRKADLTPSLNSVEDIQTYLRYGCGKSCVVRVSFGLNVGVPYQKIAELKGELGKIKQLTVLGHLPFADDKNSSHNTNALKDMIALRQHLPHARFSLASTAAIFLGSEFFMDEARIGVGLFGAVHFSNNNAAKNAQDKISFALKLKAYTRHSYSVKKGQILGYESIAKEDMQMVVVSCGYANGLPIQKSKEPLSLPYQGKSLRLVPETLSMYNASFATNDIIASGEEVTLLKSFEDSMQFRRIEKINHSELLLRISRAHQQFIP